MPLKATDCKRLEADRLAEKECATVQELRSGKSIDAGTFTII
jgi:hypothetical protein